MSAPARPPLGEIRHAFDRAAATYDGAARVQAQAVERLAALLAGALAANGNTLQTCRAFLDAGCGTGLGLPFLAIQAPKAQAYLLDIAPAMLATARRKGVPAALQGAPPPAYLCGDMSALPLASASVDLVWTSLSLQWCDPYRTLAEFRRVMRPGGWLALATLGPDTFHELRTAFTAVDNARHTLDFLGPAELSLALAGAGFTLRGQHREILAAHYPTLPELLRAIKAIGASRVGPGARRSPLGKGGFDSLAAAYEAFRETPGLPASHDVLFYLCSVSP